MCIPYGDFKTAMGIFYRYTSPDGDCPTRSNQQPKANKHEVKNTK